MKRIKESESVTFSNGPTCTGKEYSFEDRDMNVALVTVNGRYPESGYVMNEACKEMAYVVSGTGSLCGKNGDRFDVLAGDATFMEPGEMYFWEGNDLVMIMPCAPAFYPEQHKKVA